MEVGCFENDEEIFFPSEKFGEELWGHTRDGLIALIQNTMVRSMSKGVSILFESSACTANRSTW